jgi:hypothetical protein
MNTRAFGAAGDNWAAGDDDDGGNVAGGEAPCGRLRLRRNGRRALDSEDRATTRLVADAVAPAVPWRIGPRGPTNLALLLVVARLHGRMVRVDRCSGRAKAESHVASKSEQGVSLSIACLVSNTLSPYL